MSTYVNPQAMRDIEEAMRACQMQADGISSVGKGCVPRRPKSGPVRAQSVPTRTAPRYIPEPQPHLVVALLIVLAWFAAAALLWTVMRAL